MVQCEIVVGLANPEDAQARGFAGEMRRATADHAHVSVSVVDISGSDGARAILRMPHSAKRLILLLDTETPRPYTYESESEYDTDAEAPAPPVALLTDGRTGGALSAATLSVHEGLSARGHTLHCMRGDFGPAFNGALHTASVLNVPCVGIVLLDDNHTMASDIVSLVEQRTTGGVDRRPWAWTNPFAENDVGPVYSLSAKGEGMPLWQRMQLEFLVVALVSAGLWVAVAFHGL